MVDATIGREISECLGKLPVEQQRRVLDFARTLATTPIRGVPGSSLLKFAGRIGDSDLDAMSRAIDEGCERIDADEW